MEKLRSQVSAQEAAVAETEAEVAARLAAVNSLKEKERALQREVSGAEAEAENITASLRRTVLAVSQVTRSFIDTLKPSKKNWVRNLIFTKQVINKQVSCPQANIKIAHLEEQHRLITEATEALSGSGASHHHTTLAPCFAQEHLDKVVRGATPNDALVIIIKTQ